MPPSIRRVSQLNRLDVDDIVDTCAEYDIEIGGGLGPVAGKVWRIGTMGHTARASNVEMFLAALDDLL